MIEAHRIYTNVRRRGFSGIAAPGPENVGAEMRTTSIDDKNFLASPLSSFGVTSLKELVEDVYEVAQTYIVDHALHKKNEAHPKPEPLTIVFLIEGLPGAGKSNLVRALIKEFHQDLQRNVNQAKFKIRDAEIPDITSYHLLWDLLEDILKDQQKINPEPGQPYSDEVLATVYHYMCNLMIEGIKNNQSLKIIFAEKPGGLGVNLFKKIEMDENGQLQYEEEWVDARDFYARMGMALERRDDLFEELKGENVRVYHIGLIPSPWAFFILSRRRRELQLAYQKVKRKVKDRYQNVQITSTLESEMIDYEIEEMLAEANRINALYGMPPIESWDELLALADGGTMTQVETSLAKAYELLKTLLLETDENGDKKQQIAIPKIMEDIIFDRFPKPEKEEEVHHLIEKIYSQLFSEMPRNIDPRELAENFYYETMSVSFALNRPIFEVFKEYLIVLCLSKIFDTSLGIDPKQIRAALAFDMQYPNTRANLINDYPVPDADTPFRLREHFAEIGKLT